jgi:N-acetyltransferase
MTWLNGQIAPTTLVGQYAALVPLEIDQTADLIAAVQDGELWKHWYTVIPAPEKMLAEIERRLDLQAKGSMLPFAVIANGKAVGMTTYMNVDAANKRVEIGSTWYAQSTQRSAINTECKLMLLTHAFEKLDCIAVEFRTHWFNQQSRAAIERLGAKLDGVLRIIASEWPSTKAHLSYRLHKQR